MQQSKWAFFTPAESAVDRIRYRFADGKLSLTRPKGRDYFVRLIATFVDHGLQNICCYCRDTYSQHDRMVFTTCCKIAIGSGCNAQHIAEFGKCWNCDEEQASSEAAFVANSQFSHDQNCYTKEQPPPLSQPVTHHPITHVGSQPTTAIINANGTHSSESAIAGSNSTSVSDMRGSERSQFKHPGFIGLHEEQSPWKLALFQHQNPEDSTKKAEATPLSSRNVIAGHTQNSDLAHKGFDKANANNIEEQDFLYNGSDSDCSDFSPDEPQDRQHLHDLAQKENKQQEAKQYVIGAIRHLVEVCNAYGDDIGEADKDEVMDEIIEAVGGKMPIRQRCFGYV